jgi:hypothetical protein
MLLRRQADWCSFACRFSFSGGRDDKSFAGSLEVCKAIGRNPNTAHISRLPRIIKAFFIEKYGLKINGVIFVTRPMSGH